MGYLYVVDTRPPPPHQSTHTLPGTIVISETAKLLSCTHVASLLVRRYYGCDLAYALVTKGYDLMASDIPDTGFISPHAFSIICT